MALKQQMLKEIRENSSQKSINLHLEHGSPGETIAYAIIYTFYRGHFAHFPFSCIYTKMRFRLGKMVWRFVDWLQGL